MLAFAWHWNHCSSKQGISVRLHTGKSVRSDWNSHKKIYSSLDELQKDLDDWLAYYNNERTHQGKMCCGRTPMETFLDGKRIWQEKVDSLNLN